MARYLAALLLFAGACGEREDIREWTPADHGHMPDEGVDPSRGPRPTPAEADPLRAVKALWTVSCASCHGAEGAGDGPGAPAGLRMPNFRAANTLSARSDEELAESIRRGKNMMPPFGDRMSPDAIRELVAHVRRMGAPAEAPAAAQERVTQ